VWIRLDETNPWIACSRQTEQPSGGGGDQKLAGLPETEEARGGAWRGFWR
jgi:hypothetical protein